MQSSRSARHDVAPPKSLAFQPTALCQLLREVHPNPTTRNRPVQAISLTRQELIFLLYLTLKLS
jgi:hypothetical protein